MVAVTLPRHGWRTSTVIAVIGAVTAVTGAVTTVTDAGSSPWSP